VKILIKSFIFVFLLINLFVLESVGSHQWDKGEVPNIEPFAYEFETINYNKITGEVDLKMVISYLPDANLKVNCNELIIYLFPFKGLVIEGSDTLKIPYKTINIYTHLLELQLPPNDTSYLIFWWECDNVSREFGQALATTNDTLEIFLSNGGFSSELSLEWSTKQYFRDSSFIYDNEQAKLEWEEKQEPIPTEVTVEDGVYILPDDSTYYNTLSDKDKKRFVKMRVLERKMLTDAHHQAMIINGICYGRDSGEFKFKVLPSETDEEIKARHQRIRDSVDANPNEHVY